MADQLLLPMALAGGGSFTAVASSPHLKSNAIVVEKFTGRRVSLAATEAGKVVSIH